MSKVIEKVVDKQLINYVENNGLSVTLQSAYKQYHSTETALTKIQNDILLSMDRHEISLLILLDLSAAFDTVDFEILLNRLKCKFGISGTVLSWLKSYLCGRKQVVSVKNEYSNEHILDCGVPQGSVLGPLLFSLYVSPLVDIAKKYDVNFHSYADDTQLYVSFKPGSSNESKALSVIESCINEIKIWMFNNKLKLNDDKTEFLVIGSKRLKASMSKKYVKVGDIMVEEAFSAKNLGVIFDGELSMKSQVSSVCKSTFFKLKLIAQIRKYLSKAATEMIIHALISSCLDYCNSLFYGLPNYMLKKLQMVQNAAARLILKGSKYDHVTPFLKELHWLPITYRIKYKILLITYKCLNGQGPAYLCDLLSSLVPLRRLRSSSASLLYVPRTRLKTYGDRSFYYAAPSLWNSLPENVKNAATVESFKKGLKTHLFNMAYI